MTCGKKYTEAYRRWLRMVVVAAERGHPPEGHRLEVMPAEGTPQVIWCHTCNMPLGPPPPVRSWFRLVRRKSPE